MHTPYTCEASIHSQTPDGKEAIHGNLAFHPVRAEMSIQKGFIFCTRRVGSVVCCYLIPPATLYVLWYFLGEVIQISPVLDTPNLCYRRRVIPHQHP